MRNDTQMDNRVTVDSRVTCATCAQRAQQLAAGQRRASEVYEVGNPANTGMGHAYYCSEQGRIALCIAKERPRAASLDD